MTPKYDIKDVLAVGLLLFCLAVGLLLFYPFFVIVLIIANWKAWSDMSKDKEAAPRRDTRIPERELLCGAWFGGPCGVIAMFMKDHKVQKPEFFYPYRRRCCFGICILLVVHIIVFLISYLFGLPRVV